jgi:iron complex transport system ATP-binding protein
MTPVLELIDARAVIGGRTVLDGVSLRVEAGEVFGVLGANGSGKTTLLRAALGLTPLADGEARLAGRPVGTMSAAERAAHAGYLPQERRVGWNMPAVAIAALGAPGRSETDARRLAGEALALVGLGQLTDRGVLDMSGGERARVLIARLLVTAAPLLIADEPAAGLDPESQLRIMEILAARAAVGAAVVVTVHDLTLAARCCDRLAVLVNGTLAASGPPARALTPEVLRAAFGLEGEPVTTSAGVVVAARRALTPLR